MEIHPQQGALRTLAKAILGAFVFMVAASFWILPCLATSKSELFSSVSGSQSCQEHKLFKAQADLSKLEFLPAEAFFRFLVALPALFAAFALSFVAVRARSAPSGRIRVRTSNLPFVTSNPPKLPAFAALRDA